MKVIAVTNRKGGVGKSTMTSHIAAGLARKGYNVGLIDTDSQGHAGMMLGLPPEDGLYNLLIEKDTHPLEDVIRIVPKENYGEIGEVGNLYLIPSAENTYKIPHLLQADESFLFFAKVEDFSEVAQLDFVLIDTNPSMSMFDGSIYLAADAFIYVTECEMLSLQGVQKALQQMNNFRTQRKRFLQRDSKVLGIIPNKYRVKTLIHERNVEVLQDAFGDLVWEPIMLRTIWAEASNFHTPVFIHAPESKAAQQAWEIVNRTERELRVWQTTTEKKD